MRSTDGLDARTGLDKLATFPYQIATWVGDDGYPVSVAHEQAALPSYDRRQSGRLRTEPNPSERNVRIESGASQTLPPTSPEPFFHCVT